MDQDTFNERGSLREKRIFIIEDKPDNYAIMSILLEKEGAKVKYDRWGVDTLARLRIFSPIDLILLDLMFPNNLTGYDLFDRIRAEDTFAKVPIVAVSASDISTAIPKTRAKGFYSFIAKPIDFDLFPKQIAQILNQIPIWYAG